MFSCFQMMSWLLFNALFGFCSSLVVFYLSFLLATVRTYSFRLSYLVATFPFSSLLPVRARTVALLRSPFPACLPNDALLQILERMCSGEACDLRPQSWPNAARGRPRCDQLHPAC